MDICGKMEKIAPGPYLFLGFFLLYKEIFFGGMVHGTVLEWSSSLIPLNTFTNTMTALFANRRLPRPQVEGLIANFDLQWHNFWEFLLIFMIFWVCQHLGIFWSHPSVDQPTVDNGGVRRGWSVALAVIVSDNCQVTCDMGHMTYGTWHMTHDIWHMTSIYLLYCVLQKLQPKGAA